MLNPPPSGRDSGSYVNLLSRMIQNVKRQKAAEQVLEIIQRIYEHELEKEHLVLSRPERKRLFRQVSQAVLKELLGELDKPDESQ